MPQPRGADGGWAELPQLIAQVVEPDPPGDGAPEGPDAVFIGLCLHQCLRLVTHGAMLKPVVLLCHNLSMIEAALAAGAA